MACDDKQLQSLPGEVVADQEALMRRNATKKQGIPHLHKALQDDICTVERRVPGM